MRIVHEYETSKLTYSELAQKHGLPCGNTIASWRRRLDNSKKVVSLQPEKKANV